MNQSDIRNNFAKNLVDLRKSRNLSQKDLGDKINYSFKNVSKWENGETMPDIYTLYSIAEVFNVKVDDLISNKDNLIHKSFRKHNHLLITVVSSLLPYVIALTVFIVMHYLSIPHDYYAFLYGGIVSAITFIVFAAIYYGQKVIKYGVIYLALSISLLIMFYLNFKMPYLWGILDLAIIVFVLIFFKIKFNTKKKEN